MNGMKSAGQKSFAGAREVLSPAEERFEKIRHTAGFILGPLVFIILYFKPMPSLSPQAHTLAAIIGLVVTFWVTEPIPIPMTALLGAVLCVAFGVDTAVNVFAPFSDPTIFLFIGSFILAEAMSAHQLDKRFAYRIMSLKIVGNSSARLLFVYGAICAIMSMWISNTAAAAMMFPVGLGLVYAMSDLICDKSGKTADPTRLRFGTGMMLMAAYASSAGGIGTPVGTPPNLIGMAMIEKFAGLKISFFQWMLFSVPILIVMYFALFALMYFLHKPELACIEGSSECVSRDLKELGKWTPGQRNCLIAFAAAVILWIIPGFLAMICGPTSPLTKGFSSRVPEACAALIAAILLFVLPVDWKKREFTITWRNVANIDWGTLILFGGGITLGNQMFKTKLAEVIGAGLLNLSGADSVWSVTLAATVIAIMVSEATSNTASANMVVPVIISLSLAAGINPVPPAIGATLGASWGFMLPVSTPPNAIVYGSGMIPITKMIRAGIFFDIAGALIIWLGLRVLLPLIGLV